MRLVWWDFSHVCTFAEPYSSFLFADCHKWWSPWCCCCISWPPLCFMRPRIQALIPGISSRWLSFSSMPTNLTRPLTALSLSEAVFSAETVASLCWQKDVLGKSLLLLETLSTQTSTQDFDAKELLETSLWPSGFLTLHRSFLTVRRGTRNNFSPRVRSSSGRTTESHGRLKTSRLPSMQEGYFSKIITAGIAM